MVRGGHSSAVDFAQAEFVFPGALFLQNAS
jgi:hypothetical protein